MDEWHVPPRAVPAPRDSTAGPTPPPGRTLLALRCLGLGDFVTAVPALRALERALPGHLRLLAAPEAYRDLVRMAGLDWTVLAAEPLRVPPWRGPAPDVAVNLHGRGPRSTAALRALAPARLWAYAPPGGPGPRNAPEGRAIPEHSRDALAPWPGPVHDSRLWCGLLEWNGVAARPTDVYWPRPAPTPREHGAAHEERRADRSTAVLHPGAMTASRRWPAERFARVARWLRAQGLRVLLTGSAEERPLADRVAEEAGLGSEAVTAGRTDLPRLARLVSGAGLLVSGDTGVAHLATAYATPSVRLFGPVSPSLWGPLVDPGLHECLWTGTAGDPHGDRLDPGLEALDVAAVREACARVLTRSCSDRRSPDGARDSGE